MKTLIAVLLLALAMGCACPEEKVLVDFDLCWTNPYKVPVDQLSIQNNITGQVFAANVAYKPYVRPNEGGMFVIVMERQDYQDLTMNGFRVINARTR